MNSRHFAALRFDYHLKLHYSQTGFRVYIILRLFDYHLKLHYSQTVCGVTHAANEFDYHLKLHYSQTQTHQP